MKFLKTSRKDDMISLFYMIIFLLNENEILAEKELLESLEQMDAL